jgi:hypothetical protein
VFLSPDDPLGFGRSDWIELGVAVLLVALARVAARLRPTPLAFAHRPISCMCALFALPILLRLALLPHSPAPVPSGADDFSYILLGDTLRHFRFANPPNALSQFFEQIFVLQGPTRSSIYPLGQAFFLACGWIVFGQPWVGVLVAAGALAASCYWMLRAWIAPRWALAGGVLAAMEFGPLCYWMNCYWGGAVSAVAGCLVFGALPRLQTYRRKRDAVVLGLGLALQLLTRPFEFFLLLASALLFLIPILRRAWKQLTIAAALLALGVGTMLAQNKAVTHTWATLPYMLYRYQYGVPATFTFEANPVPHRALNSEQELDYRAETAIHGDSTDTIATYLERLLFRIRFYRFFFFAPLYLAVAAFALTIRTWKSIWIGSTLLLFALGSNFYPYFYPHYIAAVTCLFVLIAVSGLERLKSAGGLLFALCVAQFLFWFGGHAFLGADARSRLARYESWDFINYGDPQGRILIDNELSYLPGKHLVFVRYGAQHMFQEWVHNGVDLEGARTVWAHDLGDAENQKLLQSYPERSAWLLEPDKHPPRLMPYKPHSASFESVP